MVWMIFWYEVWCLFVRLLCGLMCVPLCVKADAKRYEVGHE